MEDRWVERGLVAAGEYDHPLTSTALLELGRLALEAGNHAAAARYFETGMVHYENHRWNFALRDWNEAIKLDPNFALAYTWICFTTVDPAEERKGARW